MQKKIIALAVAGLVSGAAFAQSNVTVYGIADAGYVYYSGARNDAKSVSAIESGNWSTSRVGFKGTEDLGNGLKANFVLEQSARLDTTDIGGRKSWVGLSGDNWGEIKLGSFGTFHDDLIGSTNVMAGNSTAASPGKVYVLTSGQAATGDFHNAAAYYSPKFGGLQVKAAVSTNARGPESEPIGLARNDRVYSAAVHYANGPLIAGLAVERNKIQSTDTNSYDSGKAWNLGAMYDFKVVRVNAAYGINDYSEDVGSVEKRKQWQVGLAVPVGNGYFAVNYARAKLSYLADATDDDKLSMWGVGYFHALSKRTSLYGVYGQISQDDSNTTFASYGPTGSPLTNTYEKAFQAGIRHTF